MKILIIEDDKELAEGIALYLTGSNPDFDVEVETDGEVAFLTVKREMPDLIVLDVLLGKVSGYDLCKDIKMLEDIPIIFLSNLGEEEDRINGLLSGGDDYLGKPFSLKELLLRINVRLRDKENSGRAERTGITHEYGEIKLSQRLLLGAEKDIILTETEYNILLLLARNEGSIISQEDIYRTIWGTPYDGDLRTIQTHTANLRRKLEEAYGTKRHIGTQWGKGYVFQR